MKNQSIFRETMCLVGRGVMLSCWRNIMMCITSLLALGLLRYSVEIRWRSWISFSTRPKFFDMIGCIFRSWVHARGKSSQPASRPSSTPSFTTHHQPHRPHHREKKKEKRKGKRARPCHSQNYEYVTAHIPPRALITTSTILIRGIFL